MALPNIRDVQARALAAVDQVWAEPLELLFLDKEIRDPERQNVTIEAPFRVGGEDTPKAGSGVGWSSRIASGMAEMRPDAATWPAAAHIRTGDKVRAVSRPGQPVFRVVNVDDRSAPRLIVKLGQA